MILTWRDIGFETYQDYLNHWMWQKKQDFVLDEITTCEICGSAENLRIHHKKEGYKRIPQERKQDLVVVCKACHNKIHRGEINVEGKS